MQTVTKQYPKINIDYPLDKIAPLEDILFLDIETTGFSSRSSVVYLIGCAFYDGVSFTCKQFFAEKPIEEIDILQDFMSFAAKYKKLIHFNGNNFDLPYLEEKCKRYNIDFTIANATGIDIYKRIAPYKIFLKTPNCKQKTLEQYLGIEREDVLSGGDLISVYDNYVSHFNVKSLTKLLLHNENDIQGMIQLLPILAYSDIFNEEITVTRVNMEKYTDYNGMLKTELVMKLVLPTKLPSPISHMSMGFFFNGNENNGILKIPVYDGELKYFYANYKDYYYLPAEDEALHKSVASFVDKEHRKQATAATCYTRVNSIFLPVYDKPSEPFFKKEYTSKSIYIELTAEKKKDRAFFSKYASEILNIIATTN